MSFIPVLFEDHNLSRFRPLTWSAPLFEIRCGMFTARERVGLTAPSGPGILLNRPLLDDLHRAEGWQVGPAALAAMTADPAARFLFVSGRLAPDAAITASLFALEPATADFIWEDKDGIVAALLTGERAAALGEHWRRWEDGVGVRGGWTRSGSGEIPPLDHPFPNPQRTDLPGGGACISPAGAAPVEPGHIAILDKLAAVQSQGPRWIWDLVPATTAAMTADLKLARRCGSFRRQAFGIFPDLDRGLPGWVGESRFENPGAGTAGCLIEDPRALFLADDVELSPGTAISTAGGPVIIDRSVRVMPHCYLEGPLYLGPGSLVKPGARIHGQSSFGIVNRIAGEIGESTFGDFANKQHEGFIGHAVLGSWINLGAMTTCSDLKNNYGEIRVDLGEGAVATGRKFIGLLLGDHAKTAIGTLFNTGSAVGFATNIFGAGMPPKHVPNFRWGWGPDATDHALDRATATAETVMNRRGCLFTDAHRRLFAALA